MLARLFRADAPSVHSHLAWEDLPDDALSPPPLLDGLGDAHLPVTTDVPLAQAYFDQGLRLLHLGWALEARRAFAEAARQDPSLAMAWWGLALARGVGARFTSDRAEAIRKALTLAEGASDLEQRLIVAASLLADKGPANGRHAFVREMECLIDRLPEEPEPRLLLAGFLLDGYESDGRPGQGQPYAQLLLRDLMRTHPRHAGVHLGWVQAWLPSPRPETARESAELLPSLAPAGGPALLAAGRLLLRVGRVAEGNAILEAAVAADDAYLARESLPLEVAPVADLALRLLSEGCAEVGQYRGAQSWARKLRQRVEASGARPQAVLFAATTLVAAHLRFGFCRAAAEVPMELGEHATVAEAGLRDAVRLYARGANALETGRLGDVERACAALEALVPVLSEAPRSEGRALCPRDVARTVEVAAQELRGTLDARRGDCGRAEAALTRALRLERRLRPQGPALFCRPPRETLARVRLRSGREEKALELALERAGERPGCGHCMLLVAEAHVACECMSEAEHDFAVVLDLWRDADPHLPGLQRARGFAARGGRGRAALRRVPDVAVDSAPVLRGGEGPLTVHGG
jgi:tetratricopeptide (TPR) repeat protein